MDERHRVLIADSYPDEAEQLKKELSGKYNVISVRDNGVDTLDDIIKLKPDLVVIDLMLSEIDGIGVIEKCRELIEPDKIPAFIALTMLENRELMECIRRLKVDYCMMKPFQAGILAERISQMLFRVLRNCWLVFRARLQSSAKKRHHNTCTSILNASGNQLKILYILTSIGFSITCVTNHVVE